MIMATLKEKYQGWANWETWNVALWFGNDYGLYQAIKGHPEKFTAASARSFVLKKLPDGTPDFSTGTAKRGKKNVGAFYAKVDWKEIADDFNEMLMGELREQQRALMGELRQHGIEAKRTNRRGPVPERGGVKAVPHHYGNGYAYVYRYNGDEYSSQRKTPFPTAAAAIKAGELERAKQKEWDAAEVGEMITNLDFHPHGPHHRDPHPPPGGEPPARVDASRATTERTLAAHARAPVPARATHCTAAIWRRPAFLAA